jgi:cellobiose dehydrogenase (acceptor)
VAAVKAQSTSAYTDSLTGITFQQYATTNFSFGIATPSSPSDEFIAQIVAPITGWAGISFGGSMVDSLLLTAWANEGSMVQEFRMARQA